MRSGTQLDPRNASTVRVRDGQRQVQDGPSREGHALFGGLWWLVSSRRKKL